MGGRDKEEMGGGGAGTHGFKGELMGHQSTSIYYKGGELKKITC